MDAPEGCKQGWSLDDGVLVAPPAAPEPSYNKKRQNEYPNFGDQFDLLWHAIDTGNWTVEKLKTTDFYTKLKKVKDDNPKS